MSPRPPRQHQPRQPTLPGLAGDGRAPTVVDLFCGAGGLSEGFQRAGFQVTAGSDHDPDAIATYATNFPAAAALCGDVRDPSLREELDAAAAGADVLVGGPPCQAFSQVRNHSRLIEDPRNSLYREFVSAVGAASPDVFLMENVPGMAQMGVVDQVVTDLSLDGQYAVQPQLVDAADFGVPQSRKRLLFLGVRSSLGIAPPLLVGSGITAAVQLLRFTEASPMGPAGTARWKFSVEEGLERAESLVIDLTGGLAPGGDADDEELLAAAAARRGPQAAAALAEGLSAYYAVAARPDEAGQMLALALADPEDLSAVTSFQAISDLAVLTPGRRDDVIAAANLPAPASAYQRLMRTGCDAALTNVSVPRIREDTSLRLAGIPAGGNHRDLAEHLQARYLTDTRWGPSNGTGRLGRAHYYAYRRLHPDMFAWTLNTKGDSVYHYSAARCLSVREFSRLQSFPDNFAVTTDTRRGPLEGRVDGGAAHSRYRQIGNAVPPLLAAAAATALGDVLRTARGVKSTTGTRLTQQRAAAHRSGSMVGTGTGELFGR